MSSGKKEGGKKEEGKKEEGKKEGANKEGGTRREEHSGTGVRFARRAVLSAQGCEVCAVNCLVSECPVCFCGALRYVTVRQKAHASQPQG